MKPEIPGAFSEGVERLEKLDVASMRMWLEAEVQDKVHILSGQEDDQPVQAILNHFPYLRLVTQSRLLRACSKLLAEWIQQKGGWSESATLHLLDLVAELPVEDGKIKLQGNLKKLEVSDVVYVAVLQTIATLSVNADRQFWLGIASTSPDYAGMAFQVLARIAPAEAHQVIRDAASSERAFGSLVRKLPNFVSQFTPPEQEELLHTIAKAISSLPARVADGIESSLREEGFDVSRFKVQSASLQKRQFLEVVMSISQTITRTSSMREVYAKQT